MSKGRQTRDGATVRRVQVMLDEATIDEAKKLGAGNLSAGIRKATKEAVQAIIDEARKALDEADPMGMGQVN